jgi:tRNA(Ile)-lysidine synthase
VPRARLAATTAAAGLTPHDDPMNADPRFHRVRLRQLLPALAAAGLDAAALAATAARLAAAADASAAAVDTLIADAVAVDAFAVAHLRAGALAAAPAEVGLRLLVRILQAIGGEDYPPRSAQVEALRAGLGAPTATKRTLAGVVIDPRPGAVRFYREAGRAGLPALAAPPGSAFLWDRRFRIEVAPGAPRGLFVAALGAVRPPGLSRPAGLPAAAFGTLPAVFRGGKIVALPSLGWLAPGERAAGIAAAEAISGRLGRPPRFPPGGDS